MLNFWAKAPTTVNSAERKPSNAEVEADKSGGPKDGAEVQEISSRTLSSDNSIKSLVKVAVLEETVPPVPCTKEANHTEDQTNLNSVTSGATPSPPRSLNIARRSIIPARMKALALSNDVQVRRNLKVAIKRYTLASMLPFTNSIQGSAERRIREEALAVQKLIVGPMKPSKAGDNVSRINRSQLATIKSRLIDPTSAKKLISELRELPLQGGPAVGDNDSTHIAGQHAAGPIHAVCLPGTENEVAEKHFAKLGVESVAAASIDAISSALRELHIVDLLSAPDLGLGQPGDGSGLLAGAIPPASTIIDGIRQLSPQLLGLGYALGKAIDAPHAQIHPPTDRISILAYWWGFELCLPRPSISRLDKSENICHEVINVLAALSLLQGGVREILPFVHYISQFIDVEFDSIKAEDKGRGVVCVATWVIPAALVSRPWDFTDAQPASDMKSGTSGTQEPKSVEIPQDTPAPPAGATSITSNKEVAMKADQAKSVDDTEKITTISHSLPSATSDTAPAKHESVEIQVEEAE